MELGLTDRSIITFTASDIFPTFIFTWIKAYFYKTERWRESEKAGAFFCIEVSPCGARERKRSEKEDFFMGGVGFSVEGGLLFEQEGVVGIQEKSSGVARTRGSEPISTRQRDGERAKK